MSSSSKEIEQFLKEVEKQRQISEELKSQKNNAKQALDNLIDAYVEDYNGDSKEGPTFASQFRNRFQEYDQTMGDGLDTHHCHQLFDNLAAMPEKDRKDFIEQQKQQWPALLSMLNHCLGDKKEYGHIEAMLKANGNFQLLQQMNQISSDKSFEHVNSLLAANASADNENRSVDELLADLDIAGQALLEQTNKLAADIQRAGLNERDLMNDPELNQLWDDLTKDLPQTIQPVEHQQDPATDDTWMQKLLDELDNESSEQNIEALLDDSSEVEERNEANLTSFISNVAEDIKTDNTMLNAAAQSPDVNEALQGLYDYCERVIARVDNREKDNYSRNLITKDLSDGVTSTGYSTIGYLKSSYYQARKHCMTNTKKLINDYRENIQNQQDSSAAQKRNYFDEFKIIAIHTIVQSLAPTLNVCRDMVEHLSIKVEDYQFARKSKQDFAEGKKNLFTSIKEKFQQAKSEKESDLKETDNEQEQDFSSKGPTGSQ